MLSQRILIFTAKMLFRKVVPTGTPCPPAAHILLLCQPWVVIIVFLLPSLFCVSLMSFGGTVSGLMGGLYHPSFFQGLIFFLLAEKVLKRVKIFYELFVLCLGKAFLILRNLMRRSSSPVRWDELDQNHTMPREPGPA